MTNKHLKMLFTHKYQEVAVFIQTTNLYLKSFLFLETCILIPGLVLVIWRLQNYQKHSQNGSLDYLYGYLNFKDLCYLCDVMICFTEIWKYVRCHVVPISFGQVVCSLPISGADLTSSTVRGCGTGHWDPLGPPH